MASLAHLFEPELTHRAWCSATGVFSCSKRAMILYPPIKRHEWTSLCGHTSIVTGVSAHTSLAGTTSYYGLLV